MVFFQCSPNGLRQEEGIEGQKEDEEKGVGGGKEGRKEEGKRKASQLPLIHSQGTDIVSGGHHWVMYILDQISQGSPERRTGHTKRDNILIIKTKRISS